MSLGRFRKVQRKICLIHSPRFESSLCIVSFSRNVIALAMRQLACLINFVLRRDLEDSASTQGSATLGDSVEGS